MISDLVRIAVLDTGSVKVARRSNGRIEKTVGWAALDAEARAEPWSPRRVSSIVDRGQVLAELADCVSEALEDDRPVALGFESPCFVPVPDNEAEILSPRQGEQRRSFSAAAGANSLVAGLVEATWLLARLRGTGATATVDPTQWPEPHAILLWEAFVSEKDVGAPLLREQLWGEVDCEHVRDAAAAVDAFVRHGRPDLAQSAVWTRHTVLNTLAAAAISTGLSDEVAELSLPCFVLKAGAQTSS